MIIAHEISTDRFSYDPRSRTFSTFASDIKGTDFLSQVWDDACDVGFRLVNPRTGKSVVFTCYRDVRRDGDLLCWEFRSYRQPGDEIRAVIFND